MWIVQVYERDDSLKCTLLWRGQQDEVYTQFSLNQTGVFGSYYRVRGAIMLAERMHASIEIVVATPLATELFHQEAKDWGVSIVT